MRHSKRHVSGQPAPAATGFCNAITWLKLKLSADVVHLCLLRRLQGHIGLGKIRTGVLHLCIQPEPVKIVADIVVVMNILSRARLGVGPRLALLHLLHQFGDALWLRHTKRGNQKIHQIAVYGDLSTREGLTKSSIALAQQLNQGIACMDMSSRDGLSRGRMNCKAVPENH